MICSGDAYCFSAFWLPGINCDIITQHTSLIYYLYGVLNKRIFIIVVIEKFFNVFEAVDLKNIKKLVVYNNKYYFIREATKITDQGCTTYNDTVNNAINTRWHEMLKRSKLQLNQNIITRDHGWQIFKTLWQNEWILSKVNKGIYIAFISLNNINLMVRKQF